MYYSTHVCTCKVALADSWVVYNHWSHTQKKSNTSNVLNVTNKRKETDMLFMWVNMYSTFKYISVIAIMDGHDLMKLKHKMEIVYKYGWMIMQLQNKSREIVLSRYCCTATAWLDDGITKETMHGSNMSIKNNLLSKKAWCLFSCAILI